MNIHIYAKRIIKAPKYTKRDNSESRIQEAKRVSESKSEQRRNRNIAPSTEELQRRRRERRMARMTVPLTKMFAAVLI